MICVLKRTMYRRPGRQEAEISNKFNAKFITFNAKFIILNTNSAYFIPDFLSSDQASCGPARCISIFIYPLDLVFTFFFSFFSHRGEMRDFIFFLYFSDSLLLLPPLYQRTNSFCDEQSGKEGK